MQQARIVKIVAREILDSRGYPTVEVGVTLSDGTVGCASVPSGASTGSHEKAELRDGDPRRFRGRGVLSAVENINRIIAPALSGVDAYDQYQIDDIMLGLDGTKDRSRMGANALLAVSLAAARAGSASLAMPLYRYVGGSRANTLPIPMMNILNGGKHASNNIDIQEFMIVPVGAGTFRESVEICSDIYAVLRETLLRKGLSVAVGDEGGFAPDLPSDESAIEALIASIEGAGYDTDTVGIALDAAASEWVTGEGYRLPKRGTAYTRDALMDYWVRFIETYPILSIEDAMGEDDVDGWRHLTDRVGDRVMLVGDDLFVTDVNRLATGIDEGCANSILIKPNQIGTLTETLEVIDLAVKCGYRHILSHRSGETEDTCIADLAVATSAPYIKAGAPCRGERVVKYNRLMKIEGALYDAARFGE